MKITLLNADCLSFRSWAFLLGRAVLLFIMTTVQAQQQPVPLTLKPTNAPRDPTTDTKKEDKDPLPDRNPVAPPISPVTPVAVPSAPSAPKPPVGRRAPSPSKKDRGPTKTPTAPTNPPSSLPSLRPTNPPSGLPTTLQPTLTPTSFPTVYCPGLVNCNAAVEILKGSAPYGTPINGTVTADFSCFATPPSPQSTVNDCTGVGAISKSSFSGHWYKLSVTGCSTGYSTSLTVHTTGSSNFFPGIFLYSGSCTSQTCIPLTSGTQGCPSGACSAATTNTITWTPYVSPYIFVVPFGASSYGTYSLTFACTSSG